MARQVTGIIVLSLIPMHAYAAMPANSFLLQPVHSSHDLVHQVQTKKLQARYAKALSIPVSHIDSLMSRLRLVHASREARVRMYFFHSNTGKLGWSMRTIHRGDGMFVLPSGAPLLYQKCGNLVFDMGHPASYVKSTFAPPRFAVPEETLSSKPFVPVTARKGTTSAFHAGIPDVPNEAATEGLPAVVASGPTVIPIIPPIVGSNSPKPPVVGSTNPGSGAQESPPALHVSSGGGSNNSGGLLIGGLGGLTAIGLLLGNNSSHPKPNVIPPVGITPGGTAGGGGLTGSGGLAGGGTITPTGTGTPPPPTLIATLTGGVLYAFRFARLRRNRKVDTKVS